MFTQELRSKIDQIWLAFHSGGLANPLTVIEQITYLLFIKRLDELHIIEENKANFAGIAIENPVFMPGEENLRWSVFKNENPENLFKLFTKENGVFDFMKNYGSRSASFNKFMKGATFMIPTPRLLLQVIDMLNEIPMNDADTKGNLYEYLLSKISTSGTNGQFRTPRHIIKMMVEMMQPNLEEIICDPSSGTCGFLVSSAEYLKEKYSAELMKPKNLQHFTHDMFLGMEFDATMIRIGAMNMILHGIENPTLIDVDSLSESNSENFDNTATLVLANPPFKGSLDNNAVDEKILRIVDSKKTELLFLGLILKGLKVGGRAAVIVPDGVLFGSSKAHQKIRKELVENHSLEAVISMPSGVFKPYAGVSTAVLVFTKTNAGGTENVWFYDMKADGFSLDDKRNTIKENDIPDIISRYHARKTETERARTEQSFLVPKSEIATNNYDLSINRYKEIIYEQKEYETPKNIMAKIAGLDAERKMILTELEKML